VTQQADELTVIFQQLIWNDIGSNCCWDIENSQILTRTFTCRSTFLYVYDSSRSTSKKRLIVLYIYHYHKYAGVNACTVTVYFCTGSINYNVQYKAVKPFSYRRKKNSESVSFTTHICRSTEGIQLVLYTIELKHTTYTADISPNKASPKNGMLEWNNSALSTIPFLGNCISAVFKKSRQRS
jgi:hypothetical protein